VSEAEKHLNNALAELRYAKPFLHGAEDTQALTETIMVVEILANAAADAAKPRPVTRHPKPELRSPNSGIHSRD